MTADVVVDILVALGVGAQLVCAVGLLAGRTVFDRLHYSGAASTLAPFLVAAAILVEEGFTSAGINAILTAVILLALNAVLTHATARVAWRRRAASEP